MDSTQWQTYFERNQHRASPEIPAVIAALEPALHTPLLRALQCFQLGEAGEGRVAHEAAKSSDPALDDSLKRSVGLYVREEGRHARELAALLRAMGAPTLRKHSAAWLFERSRRLLGLRGKMAVIAVAEVVGATFYATLAAHTPCAPVADVARAIGRDEERHLDFQRDYFRRVRALSHPIVTLALLAWFAMGLTGAVITVAYGHRALFRALGVSPWSFARQCFARVAPRITPAPSPQRVSGS